MNKIVWWFRCGGILLNEDGREDLKLLYLQFLSALYLTNILVQLQQRGGASGYVKEEGE